MRSKAEFKAYVYEKAEAEGKLCKKKRTMLLRTATAFSLCLMITGVWLYAEGVGKNGLVADAGIKSAMAPMPLAMVEENESEVAFDCSRGTSDDADEIQFYMYKSDPACETAAVYGSGASVQYSTILDAVTVEMQTPYVIVETAEEYVGEDADIDFNTYIALVFSEKHILSHSVTYGDNEITVLLMTGEGETTPYTVLLEREYFCNQPIRVIFP